MLPEHHNGPQAETRDKPRRHIILTVFLITRCAIVMLDHAQSILDGPLEQPWTLLIIAWCPNREIVPRKNVFHSLHGVFESMLDKPPCDQECFLRVLVGFNAFLILRS